MLFFESTIPFFPSYSNLRFRRTFKSRKINRSNLSLKYCYLFSIFCGLKEVSSSHKLELFIRISLQPDGVNLCSMMGSTFAAWWGQPLQPDGVNLCSLMGSTFAAWWGQPLPCKLWSNIFHSLKHESLTKLGCKDMMPKNLGLLLDFSFFLLFIIDNFSIL